MKTLGTVVWLLVIVGGVNCDTIAYPGRSALLAYNPARGEFPVQSLFGRGYFSYVDENGNSRIVTLEANPLLGVRVGADGQPQIEIGRSIDLGNEKKEGMTDRKHDRLKPIKEFDENPFLDSVDSITVSTPATGVLRDATKEALVAASMPVIMYLPPTASEAAVPGQGTSVPDSPKDASKDVLFSTPMQPVAIPGQQGPTIMYLPPSAPDAAVPGQNFPNSLPNALGTSVPDSRKDAPKDSLFPTPMQPIAIPGQQGPTIMYLPPSAPEAAVPGQGTSVPDSPKDASRDILFSAPMQPLVITGQQEPTIMYLPPTAPDTVRPMQLFPNSPKAESSTVQDGPRDVPKDSRFAPMQSSTIPEQQGPVTMYLPPGKPETIIPRQLFSNPSPPTGPSGQGIFNPSNPFLSSNAASNPSSPINSGTVLPNPSPTACVFPNSSPPSMSEIVFPNSPLVTGSEVFPKPAQPNTESPYLSGAPLTIRPPPTVFPNPSKPSSTQGVFPNPKPPAVNPFIPQGSQNLPPSVVPIVPLDPFIPNVNNPFLPNLLLDVRVEPQARSLLKRLQRLLEGTNPELVIDTPEVEQAKRAHFLAHSLALARLENAQQQNDNDTNDQGDESLTSPLASASDSSSVYLAADRAASQAVTSGPSTVDITEQTNIVVGGTDSEDVSQALPVV